MTRTGSVPRLMQHIAEPIVEIAPADARRLQLREGELARIWSRNGVMVAKTVVSRGQRPGSLFVPMHWNNQFARRGRVNDLLSAVTDPWSGQPESKQGAGAIAPGGRKSGETAPAGRIVCSCMSIGERAIGEAIASGCRTVGELGKVLKCGTNCGSCIPELKALLAEEQIRA